MLEKKRHSIPVVVPAAIAAAGLSYVRWVRPWHSRWGATKQEIEASLPGDDLCPKAAAQVTHAITIDAPPEMVWPWILQIGQDRSGFYSYTSLENMVGCEMGNVHEIVPEWQNRAVGDTVWFATPKHFSGQARMTVAILEELRAMVLAAPADWERLRDGLEGENTTWAFVLSSAGEGKTRLVVRSRADAHPSFGKRAANWIFWEPAHFVMERKMLLTIKKLAENNRVS